MKKILQKLTQKQKIQFGAIAVLAVAIIALALFKIVSQASTLTISNTAKASYSINSTAGSATSNTVTTAILIPTPSPSVALAPTPTPTSTVTAKPTPTPTSPITGFDLTNSGLTILPSPTVKYGTLMTFKYTWTGTAPAPVKLHLCRTDQFSGGKCTGGSFCDSSNYSSSSPLSCQYTPSNARVKTNPNKIYSYVCTANNVCEHDHIDTLTVTRR